MAGDVMALEGGLQDPVFGTQAVFRALMDAYAEPGSIATFDDAVSPPAPLEPAAGAILATLADHDTPVWLADPEGAGAAAARWLRFHTGAPITADRAAASFVVLGGEVSVETWGEFRRGTPAYPDRSATVLLPVASLADGESLRLIGPGIEHARTIRTRGLPTGFVGAMATNRALFPLGLDIVLVCGAAALALPRTTRIERA